MKKKLFFFYLIVLTLFTVFSVAQEPDVQDAKNMSEFPSNSDSYKSIYKTSDMMGELSLGDLALKMTICLSIVLILMVACIYFIKRVMPNRDKISSDGVKMTRVLEKFRIDDKKSILTIWAVDRVLVIANGPDGLKVLSEIQNENLSQDNTTFEFNEALKSKSLNMSGVNHV